MISSIELLAGASLNQMIQPQATYEIQRSPDGDKFSITLAAPDLQAEGLHLQTWGSSYLLANRLHRISVTFPPKTGDSDASPFSILELGAGTGLVGLSAAAIWSQSVMLTDFASIVPGTSANVSLNETILQSSGGRARCGILDWHAPTELVVSDSAESAVTLKPLPKNRAHVILTADTLYTEEQPALLVGCIVEWLARHADARVIVCYPLRVSSLDAIRDFWARMEQAGLEAVHEQQERVDGEEWDDEKLHEWAVFRWREVPSD